MMRSFIIIGITILFFACEKEHAAQKNVKQDTIVTSICDSMEISFATDILPIFSTNCAIVDCHDEFTAESGVIFKSYSQISDRVLNGRVLCVINHEDNCPRMPYQQKKLEDSLITKIECWAYKGAPNN